MYTLEGKPDQHVTCIPRFVHVWPSTIHISRGLHIAIFRKLSTDLNRSTTSRRRAPDPTQLTVWWLTGLGSVPSFSPLTTNEEVGKRQASVDNWLLGLQGSFLWHAIGMFNTYSRGPTHWTLTDIGRAYNLRGAGFPHATPWPSQPSVSTFHLRALPGLQLNQLPLSFLFS
jgi:hypothetical protein